MSRLNDALRQIDLDRKERIEAAVAPSVEPRTASWARSRETDDAVVAREYGVPAVAGVPNATERLETGQRVLVDGTQGRVQMLA